MAWNKKQQPRLDIMGAPPTIEWVSVEILCVDRNYQRLTDGSKSRRLIYEMQDVWDWRLCQPLTVARRPDGSLMVIDGQHRLSGARARGDIKHLPCVISNFEDAKSEASSFVALNTRRQKLSQFDIFVASLQAGDVDAQKVMELLERNGISLVRSSATDSWKPRQIHSAPALQKMLNSHGEKIIGLALEVFAKSYPDKVCTSAGTFIKALCFLLRDYEDDITPEKLIKDIQQVEPDAWGDEASELKRQNPLWSRTECWVEAIYNIYDGVEI